MHNPPPILTRSAPARLVRGAGLIALLAVTVLAGIITACSSSTANSPSHTTGQVHSASGPLAFSACMRSHGLSSFPDPSTGSHGQAQIQLQPGSGINPNSAAYQSAYHSCQSLLPAGKSSGSISSAVRAQFLRYAACMRSHGEPNYPDPTFDGNTVNYKNLSAIDQNSPQFQSAVRACASLDPLNGHGGSK